MKNEINIEEFIGLVKKRLSSDSLFVNDQDARQLISFILELQEKLANAKACIVDQDIGAKAEWQGIIQDLQAENERLHKILDHAQNQCFAGHTASEVWRYIREALDAK